MDGEYQEIEPMKKLSLKDKIFIAAFVAGLGVVAYFATRQPEGYSEEICTAIAYDNSKDNPEKLAKLKEKLGNPSDLEQAIQDISDIPVELDIRYRTEEEIGSAPMNMPLGKFDGVKILGYYFDELDVIVLSAVWENTLEGGSSGPKVLNIKRGRYSPRAYGLRFIGPENNR